ncbi:MAG TPA: CHAT domain-containing protein [Pseudonocardiaceae bacterium]
MRPTPFELLGRSPIPEEYRGDYGAALTAADELVQRLRSEGDPRLLGRALLLRGMVEVTAGAPGAALHTLDELMDLPDPGPDRDTLQVASALLLLARVSWGATGVDGALREGDELALQRYQHADQVARDERLRRLIDTATTEPVEPLPPELADLPAPELAHSLLLLAAHRAQVRGNLSPGSFLGEVARRLGEALRASTTKLPPEDHWPDRVEAQLGPGDHALRALLLRHRAETAFHAGRFSVAEALAEGAAQHYVRAEDETGLGSCLLMIGDWLIAPGSSPLLLGLLTERRLMEPRSRVVPPPVQINRAAACYQAAEQHFGASPRGQAAMLLRRAYVMAAFLGRPEDAATTAAQAANLFESVGDERGYWIARTHAVLHRLTTGVPVPPEALDDLAAWASGRGSPSLAFHLGSLVNAFGGFLLDTRGEALLALRCHELAARLFHRLGTVIAEHESWIAARTVCDWVGDTARAVFFTERAVLSLAPALDREHPSRARAAMQTLILTREVVEPYVTTQDGTGLAASLQRLRPLHRRVRELLGDGPSNPLQALTDSFEQLTADDPERSLAPGLTEPLLALARYVLPRSESLLEQADLLTVLLHARELRENGHAAAAEQVLTELLTHCRRTASPAAREVEPHVLLALGRREEAVTAFEQMITDVKVPSLTQLTQALTGEDPAPAGAGANPAAEADAWAVLPLRLEFQHLAEHPAATATLAELERLAGPEWWREHNRPWHALGVVADVVERAGELDRAAELRQQAIDELESRRSGVIRDSWTTQYFGAQHSATLYGHAARNALLRRDALPAGHPDRRRLAEESFRYAERGRARALTELLLDSGSPAPEGSLLAAWRAADARSAVRHNQLHRLHAQLSPDTELWTELVRAAEQADAELAEVERALAERSPMLLRPKEPGAPAPGPAEIADALPEDTVLVSYQVLRRELLVWAVTRNGLVLAERRPLDRHALAEQVRLLRDAREQSTAVWRAPAAWLAEQLLDPVAEVLTGHRRLLVVPSGPLHHVPVHALPFRGRPLLATHIVSYLPMAAAVLRSRVTSAHTDGIAVFGDPAEMRWPNGEPADPLPGTAHEAQLVAEVTGGKACTGDQVTRETVTTALAEADVVHLATHGYHDPDAPLNSGVLLAHGERVTAAELMGLSVRARLVVLNACETASGTVTHGEEVIGLPRALLAAGAGSALVTLWPVADEAAALLAADLHRHLRDGLDPAAALRAAQDAMRTGVHGAVYRHPSCWAPFVLVGSPDTAPATAGSVATE